VKLFFPKKAEIISQIDLGQTWLSLVDIFRAFYFNEIKFIKKTDLIQK